MSELSSPVLLLYAKQNCYTLSILKTDERVQTAKTASWIFYASKARLQNVGQSCLWMVQAKCGSSGELLGFSTRVPEELWGSCPGNSWQINKIQKSGFAFTHLLQWVVILLQGFMFSNDVVLNFPLIVVSLLILEVYFSCLDTSVFQGDLSFQKEN